LRGGIIEPSLKVLANKYNVSVVEVGVEGVVEDGTRMDGLMGFAFWGVY
jgi:hypothetical protein